MVLSLEPRISVYKNSISHNETSATRCQQDMVDHLILDVLPVLLPSVDPTAITTEEKQIEKLVDVT